MKQHSRIDRLLAVLLAAATLLTLMPAAMLSVAAGDLPVRIQGMDAEALSLADAGKPNTVRLSVDTALLDVDSYDYYYLVLTGSESDAVANGNDCAAMIGHSVGYYRISTVGYTKLPVDDPTVEVVIPSAEENCVFAVLCAVEKDANGYVPVYELGIGSISLTWVDTFTYADLIEKGDADVISILPGADVNTACVTFDTDSLDYAHYDYYYLTLTDTEAGAAYNSTDCDGIIGKKIGLYRIDTGVYSALPAGAVGQTVTVEEAADFVFVVLVAVQKDATGTSTDVYLMAWRTTRLAYVPADPRTETERAYDFAVSAGFLTAGELTSVYLTYGEFLYRLWKACGSPAVQGTLTKFTGVSADGLFYDALVWAQQNGLFVASSKPIDATAAITRVSIIYILHVMAGKPAATKTVHFTDTAPGAFYIKQLDWAVNAGIVTEDVDAGAQFRPNSKAKLADAFMWVWRMNEQGLLG